MLNVFDIRRYLIKNNDPHIKELFLRTLELAQAYRISFLSKNFSLAIFYDRYIQKIDLEINWLIFMESDH